MSRSGNRAHLRALRQERRAEQMQHADSKHVSQDAARLYVVFGTDIEMAKKTAETIGSRGTRAMRWIRKKQRERAAKRALRKSN